MLCKTLDGRLAEIGRMAYTGRFWLNLREKAGRAMKQWGVLASDN
jgi:hypothetical protein